MNPKHFLIKLVEFIVNPWQHRQIIRHLAETYTLHRFALITYDTEITYLFSGIPIFRKIISYHITHNII